MDFGLLEGQTPNIHSDTNLPRAGAVLREDNNDSSPEERWNVLWVCVHPYLGLYSGVKHFIISEAAAHT